MILATGATGKSGREIVKQLSQAGAQVRALVRDPTKAVWLGELPGVEVVQGDLGQPETLDAAFKGIERALLLPAPAPSSVAEQANFIAAAVRAATPHVVKFSAVGADASAAEGFARWHGLGEEQLKASGLAYTILRPALFMQELLNTWGGQQTIYLPMGDARQAPVDTRDIAAVAVKTLTEDGHAGRTYEITGPESLTFTEIAAQIADATGREVNYVPITFEQYRQALTQMNLPAWLVEAIIDLYEKLATGVGSEVTNVVREVAGQEPTTFAAFAREHAQQFKGQTQRQVTSNEQGQVD
ncbi:MAG: NAD(P)-dependent oxidoreductase [Acidobacteria bacterium]|nr:MAG: NAD(P)-dependent oxidoreductase [Acidobacteriota bacterium]